MLSSWCKEYAGIKMTSFFSTFKILPFLLTSSQEFVHSFLLKSIGEKILKASRKENNDLCNIIYLIYYILFYIQTV